MKKIGEFRNGRCWLFLLLMVFVSVSYAQDKGGVKERLNAQLDSIIGMSYAACNNDSDSEERTNPAYYRMFTPTVLYKSAVERAMQHGYDENADSQSGQLAMDADRGALIDKMLVEVYKQHPSLVTQTEEQMRSGVSSKDMAAIEERSAIKVKTDVPISGMDVQMENLETEYRKPNYWRTSGDVSLNFTQNYVSGNWHAGGENNKTLLAILKLNLNYDDKNKITFKNTFEAHLGFTTVSGDSLHSLKTNNDMLRLESNFGYKIVKNLDLSFNMKLQTQSLPSYPLNEPEFVSNFMAPFDASFSLGLKYNPKGKNWDAELFVAPLSSYNYKFVKYGRLASRFGIREGRQHKEDFGTQVVFKPNVTFFNNIKWSARMEFYSDYSRTFFEWENKIQVQLTRYLNASLLLHTRFDDNAPGLYSSDYGYWQLKEYMMFGVAYAW